MPWWSLVEPPSLVIEAAGAATPWLRLMQSQSWIVAPRFCEIEGSEDSEVCKKHAQAHPFSTLFKLLQ